MKEQKTITLDEVIENFKVLRLCHNSTFFFSAFLVCCMIAAVIWGIVHPYLRWIIIAAGIVMGVCGAVLFAVVHRLYIKTSSAVLDYFKVAAKMSNSEILEKAKELKIPQKAQTMIGKR